jgi:mannose-6-phosphate isomerase-like protein (cupin superfamily)
LLESRAAKISNGPGFGFKPLGAGLTGTSGADAGIVYQDVEPIRRRLDRTEDLVRPQAMRAAELVGTQQAERRVLRLNNPELSGVPASNTLVANIQIVMPGEIARAHRHSAAALCLIIEGRGGYTVVNGEPVPMYPGDLVLTPN